MAKKYKTKLKSKNSNLFDGGGDILSNISTFTAGGKGSSAAGQAALGQGIGILQGAGSLFSQAAGNFDTSGIGKEVQNTNDISRADVLNKSAEVDAMKSNTAGQALSGGLTGIQAGMSFGPVGAVIGGGIGALVGGISSIFGNKEKEELAKRKEEIYQGRLDAKGRQFANEDTMNQLANIAANGGEINNMQFGNNLTEFNTGGTHEENPNGGIMQGVGANGKPNLVEEGETKWDNYIFSDRHSVDKDIISRFNLPANIDGKTFANASKILSKESKERPNDPISKRGRDAQLSKLSQAQENINGQNDLNIMSDGGDIHIKKENRGKFTQSASNAGMGVQEFADHVLANKDDYSSTQVKRANFARNAANWNSFGGDINIFAKGGVSRVYNPYSDLQAIGQPVDDFQFTPNISDIQSRVSSGIQQDIYNHQLSSQSPDYSNIITESQRYAPILGNIGLGFADANSNPEIVNYGRISPELNYSRMDYQPVDTQWMINRATSNLSGNRASVLDASGGNRAAAMAGLLTSNKQGNEYLGNLMQQVGDINYNRRNQAIQFNAGIEGQNVAAKNAANQINQQIAMQEYDANARNRAAARNARRQSVLNALSGIGAIGRENYLSTSMGKATGYDKFLNYIG